MNYLIKRLEDWQLKVVTEKLQLINEQKFRLEDHLLDLLVEDLNIFIRNKVLNTLKVINRLKESPDDYGDYYDDYTDIIKKMIDEANLAMLNNIENGFYYPLPKK